MQFDTWFEAFWVAVMHGYLNNDVVNNNNTSLMLNTVLKHDDNKELEITSWYARKKAVWRHISNADTCYI